MLARAGELGVELKWFGAEDPRGFTCRHQSWRYVEAQSLPGTDEILTDLFDIRIPLTFSVKDCCQISDIIQDSVSQVVRGVAA